MTPSGAKLVLSSFCVAGLLPNMWQIELTLHVTWCSSIMRASPAHKNAVSAPLSAPVIVHPRMNGAASDATAKSGNRRLMIIVSESARRSGA